MLYAKKRTAKGVALFMNRLGLNANVYKPGVERFQANR